MSRIIAPIVAGAFACALHAAPVIAANRTFVSALGNDANPCSISQPCRTMQAAFNATAADGEIDVLDPTGYGALTVTHGISIQGHGWASMNGPAGGAAITINAGSIDVISLRGLIIDGFGTGQNGIRFNTGGSLVVEDTIIRNFDLNGIAFMPSALSALAVSKTTISQIANNGILVQPSGTQDYQVMFNRVELYNNAASGITLDDSHMPSGVGGNIFGTAFDCTATDVTFTRSLGTAYQAKGHNVSNVFFSINRSVAAGYARGILADGAVAQAFVSQSTLELDAVPSESDNSGVINSYGDNISRSRTVQIGGTAQVTK